MNMFASAHPDDDDWEVAEVQSGEPTTPVLVFGRVENESTARIDVHLDSWESVLKLATFLQEAHHVYSQRGVK